MGNMFKKPKVKKDPDQEKLIQQQLEQKREQESEIAERRASKRRFASGRGSLISGAETGVKDTLG